ncbi:GNAT family N-acetyltransferase [Marivibrio halodurans]|uniref:GNAT family N-acetyltransferase n=1 Tax=Marivibrio halodurans TaxID=2039722 RepID=A0A8J7SL01_9PROT|nr:GNAT family N-acetyltransferase [Marivibrio halodurans]
MRTASSRDFETAVGWAEREGWNPGLDDLAAFHATDPDGFLMGFEEGEPVSSISVVRYGADFGFLGFYIVRADRRGAGLGWATWRAGMARLSGRTVGLDGVVAQQANYMTSGFELAGRNIRYGGSLPSARIDAVEAGDRCAILPASPSDLNELTAFDSVHFPTPRPAFLESWVLPRPAATAEPPTRSSLIARRGGAIAGYGTIRRCVTGYKIGPLFAEDEAVARALFSTLTRGRTTGRPVYLDTPSDNPAAVALAERMGLTPVFETARMYRGPDPRLPIERIFGITSFELG